MKNLQMPGRKIFSPKWLASVKLGNLSLLGSCVADQMVGPLIILGTVSNTVHCGDLWATAGISNPTLDADGKSHDLHLFASAFVDYNAQYYKIDAYCDAVVTRDSSGYLHFCAYGGVYNPSNAVLSGSFSGYMDSVGNLSVFFEVTDLTGDYCEEVLYCSYGRGAAP